MAIAVSSLPTLVAEGSVVDVIGEDDSVVTEVSSEGHAVATEATSDNVTKLERRRPTEFMVPVYSLADSAEPRSRVPSS